VTPTKGSAKDRRTFCIFPSASRDHVIFKHGYSAKTTQGETVLVLEVGQMTGARTRQQVAYCMSVRMFDGEPHFRFCDLQRLHDVKKNRKTHPVGRLQHLLHTRKSIMLHAIGIFRLLRDDMLCCSSSLNGKLLQ
jgi:hypothetical protein